MPGRREWGVGRVLRIQTTSVGGKPQHRISIQFPVVGHKTLLVPPARLVAPQAEVEREAGWLDTLGGRTVDDRLRKVPEEFERYLGTPAQHIRALATLYRWDDTDPHELVQWARRVADVADPLSVWSRDELSVAFAVHARERDAVLRVAAARLRQQEGPAALEPVLAQIDNPEIVARMRAALARPV